MASNCWMHQSAYLNRYIGAVQTTGARTSSSKNGGTSISSVEITNLRLPFCRRIGCDAVMIVDGRTLAMAVDDRTFAVAVDGVPDCYQLPGMSSCVASPMSPSRCCDMSRAAPEYVVSTADWPLPVSQDWKAANMISAWKPNHSANGCVWDIVTLKGVQNHLS
jgi:hypothetical protein